MIFDQNKLCTASKCLDTQNDTSVLTVDKICLCAALVSSGMVGVSAGDVSAVLSAGDIAIFASGGEIAPEPDSHVLSVYLEGAAVKAAKEEITANSGIILTDGKYCPLAAQLMFAVYSCYQSDSSRLSAACYALLCELANADNTTPSVSSLVAEAAAEIRKNFAGIYGVEELSSQLGVSKSHLVRTFSAEMGITPGKYLTSVRISEAQRLLSHREYTLDVIATLCGFSGANYLCKVFKKETGLTPAAYREKYRSTQERARTTAEDILFI